MEATPPGEELNEVLTDGCARILWLETERLALGRRISELAVFADDAGNAQELRRLWLRRRTVAGELGELRSLLRRFGPQRATARA
jgi:hypothetical protein